MEEHVFEIHMYIAPKGDIWMDAFQNPPKQPSKPRSVWPGNSVLHYFYPSPPSRHWLADELAFGNDVIELFSTSQRARNSKNPNL